MEERQKDELGNKPAKAFHQRKGFIRGLILKLLLAFTLVSFFGGGCTAYKPLYRVNYTTNQAPETDVAFTFFLIGDTGDAPDGESLPTLEALSEMIAGYDENSAVVFLGDNLYPVGMPEKGDLTYDRAYHRLNVQLEALKDYQGHAYFIAGNHDWYTYEEAGVRRQEQIIDSTLRTYSLVNNNFFMPDSACADPQMIELTGSINLLLMDTQWLLAESRDSTYKYCEVHNTEAFFQKVDTLLTQYQDEIVLVAMHHPIYTYGHHGGRNSFKNSLFPLTWRYKYAYLPLPILGNAFNLLKTYVSPQDLRNKHYRELRVRMLSSLIKTGKHIVAAGHEHNLQHIELNNQAFVVSGAGSKKNGSALGKGSKFCIGKHGFVQVDILKNGEAFFQYYHTDEITPLEKVFDTRFDLKD